MIVIGLLPTPNVKRAVVRIVCGTWGTNSTLVGVVHERATFSH
jgi:hypothetical protein